MVGGLVAGYIVVGQLEDAAGVVALGGAVLDGQQTVGTGELAVVLRVACLGGDLVAVLGWGGHIGYFDYIAIDIPFSIR